MENEIIIPEQQTETAVVLSQPSNIIADFSRAYKLAKVISTAEIIPDSYKGKPADCAIAIDMADRMGVSPIMVMQNLYVVKGKPSWAGQACKALIEGCGKFKKVRHVYTGERGSDNRGCYLSAVWADDNTPVEGTEITVKMAKDEGWYSKNPKWANMTDQMLAYRAAAFFARVHCPETLMGVHVEGESEDIEKTKRTMEDVL